METKKKPQFQGFLNQALNRSGQPHATAVLPITKSKPESGSKKTSALNGN
jgi:hypothetical protein